MLPPVQIQHGAGADRPFHTLVKLAAALTQSPIDEKASIDCSPLTRGQFEALLSTEPFREPLERFVRTQALDQARGLTRKQIRQLGVSPEGRLAQFLLFGSMDLLEQAALLVCAAAMHSRVLAVVQKGKREFLREALGREAYQVATLEAPMLYAGLGAFGTDFLLSEALVAELDEARESFAALGFSLLASAVALHFRPLAKLALARWPRESAEGHRLKKIQQKDVQLILLLLQRRMPES